MSRKKLFDYDLNNDMKYRGPLSYRWFKIFGWICIILSQITICLKMAGKLDAGIAESTTMLVAVLGFVSGLSLPFLLISNFAMILSNVEGYRRQLIRNGAAAAGIFAVFLFIYLRYFVGIAGIFSADKAETINLLNKFISAVAPNGFFAFNIFIDLFLCTIFTYFLNAEPKRIFTGKRIIILRLMAIIPVLYEVASICLKLLAADGLIILPFWIFPLLTTKPPLMFAAFIILALWLKRREKIFLKGGKTKAEYHHFTHSNRNSWHFSRFSALLFVLIGILDIILFILLVILSTDKSIPADSQSFVTELLGKTNTFMALGFGNSSSLILMAPLMLLFSYSRIHKSRSIDPVIPIVAIAIIIIIYLEAGFQALKMLPGMISGLLG